MNYLFIAQVKRNSITFLVLQIVAMVFGYAICYWQGYFEGDNFLFAVFPLIELPLLFVSFLGLSSLLILSFIRRQHRLWMSAALIVFFSLLFISFKGLPPPAAMLAYGLKDRVMHDYTLDDLRQFAREVNQGISFTGAPPFRKAIRHGDISALSESERTIYAHLLQKYPFMRWENAISIFGSDEGTITIAWGGALPGHWGCAISANGPMGTPKSTPESTMLPFSDDIYFFCGD